MRKSTQKVGVIGRLTTRMKRGIGAAVIGGTLILSGGCYGSFPITKAIYNLNGNVTDIKLVHTLIFWVFVILPVYKIAMIIDAVIFNLIEFWTGETLSISSIEHDDGTRVTLAPGEDEDTAVLTVTQPDGTQIVTYFVRSEDRSRMDVFDDQGRLAGVMERTDDGGIRLLDASGETFDVISLEDLQEYSESREARIQAALSDPALAYPQ